MSLLLVRLLVSSQVCLPVEALVTHVAGEAKDLLVNRLHMPLEFLRPRGTEVTVVERASDASLSMNRLSVVDKMGVIR